MSFTLTLEHVKSFLDPASRGEWGPFLNAIDPEVNWFIGDDTYDPTTNTGVFVRSAESLGLISNVLECPKLERQMQQASSSQIERCRENGR
jgi:hypothetical protein